jgi:hypothetical protein
VIPVRIHLVSEARAISAALAATRPAVIGTSPSWTYLRQGRSLNRSHTCIAAIVTSDDGPNFATDVTNTPGQPATCQPINVTIIMFGPGAACARANIAEKSACDIHRCTSTTCRCISGRIVLPPPKASSESWLKIAARETRFCIIVPPATQEKPTPA